MKCFILLALFASVFICNSVLGDDIRGSPDIDPVELTEALDEKPEDFFSMAPFSDLVPTAFPGMGTYRRCIRIRCPINCRICICKCIKFA